MIYELWLKTQGGGLIAGPLVGFTHLEWSLGLNRVGTLYVAFPAAEFDRLWFNQRLMADVWISGGAEPLRLLQRFFLWDFGGGWQGGARVAWLRGYDLNALANLRIVKATAGSAGAQKSGEATAVMAEYVTEALLTDVGRDISAEMPLEVTPVGNGETISYTASRGRLPAVLDGCAAVSAKAGTPVRWWFAPRSDGAELRITGRPYGRDLRGAGGLSVELGTVQNVQWSYASGNAATYGYIGGQGQGEERLVVEVDLGDGTALGRREMWAENAQITAAASLTAWGEARVWEQRAKRAATASLVDAPGFRFGYEWDLGDWFTVEDDGVAFDAEVLAVTGVVSGKQSQIKATVRNDEVAL